jgi:hypothetical protein
MSLLYWSAKSKILDAHTTCKNMRAMRKENMYFISKNREKSAECPVCPFYECALLATVPVPHTTTHSLLVHYATNSFALIQRSHQH